MIKIDEIMMNILDWQVFGLILATGAILLYAYGKKKIDETAVFSAVIQGSACLLAFGAKGVIPLLIFFVVGNIFTRIGKAKKEEKNIGQEVRTWKNVFANGGAAMIFALFYIFWPNPVFYIGLLMGLTAAMACAVADTSGTELGQVFGKNPRLIKNFKRVLAGTPGAVSDEGFVFALIGSGIMSIPLLFWGYSFAAFLICCFAGFVGMVIDSVFGCTIEREWGDENTTHWINFTTTLLAGIIAIALYVGMGVA